uniref:Uncharacterized protein n=1 Tax=Myotis myotis TaxID=51298 RepID=A0A7J7R751_MYOMY|nr:hypothetical protein mMyoMyo1_010890 [Myotis myotis]
MATGIIHCLDHSTAGPVATGISHCLDHSTGGPVATGISHSLDHGTASPVATGISHSLDHGTARPIATGISHSLDHGTARPIATGRSHCLDHSRAGLWPPWPGRFLAPEAQYTCALAFRLQRPPRSPRQTLRRKGGAEAVPRLWCETLEGLAAFAAFAEEREEVRGDLHLPSGR